MEMTRRSIKGQTRDERGRGVRLKVGPNVLIPGNSSEFLRGSTNMMELLKYLTEEVMQRLYSGRYIYRYIITYNGTTVSHVVNAEE